MAISGVNVISDVLVTIPSTKAHRLHFSHSKFSNSTCSFFRNSLSFGVSKPGIGPDRYRLRGISNVRALGESGENDVPVAPLQFESPVGQLLVQILQTHPHLVSAAIDQQLESLRSERDSEKEESSSSSQDLLYRRIAEVKEKEKQKTLEEIIYCLIVEKFVANGILMIPEISATSDPAGRVDFWPNQEKKLESVHSSEAFEMIESHLSLVLGERAVGPLDSMIQISKTKLGKLYAASIMYGYFLRRVDERYQLERSMSTLAKASEEEVDRLRSQGSAASNQMWDPDSLIRIPPDDSSGGGLTDSTEDKALRLRSYVMYLDAETLQRYATIRSKEAVSLIEKQTQALFGRPDIKVAEDGSLNSLNDEIISVTFSGLTMLVLEAVAFGSFLWDAESYVESRFHFLETGA